MKKPKPIKWLRHTRVLAGQYVTTFRRAGTGGRWWK